MASDFFKDFKGLAAFWWVAMIGTSFAGYTLYGLPSLPGYEEHGILFWVIATCVWSYILGRLTIWLLALLGAKEKLENYRFYVIGGAFLLVLLATLGVN